MIRRNKHLLTLYLKPFIYILGEGMTKNGRVYAVVISSIFEIDACASRWCVNRRLRSQSHWRFSATFDVIDAGF